MKNLNLQIKLLAVPLGTFVSIIILVVLSANILLGRIVPLNDEISSNTVTKNALEQKLSNLQALNDQILGLTEAAYIALPSDNSSAIVLSQIKKIAAEYQLELTAVNIVPETNTVQSTLFRAAIQVRASGTTTAALDFLKRLQNLAPIVTIDNARLDTSTGENAPTTLVANVFTYWAPFPEQLPALTEPISALSAEEMETLNKLNSLESPQFIELSPTLTGEFRANPFSVQ